MPEGDGQVQQAESALGDELMRIHQESYGKGAESARIYIHDDVVFALLDRIELLPNEEFLIDAGQASAVTEVRGRYQQAIETSFRAAVERHTGRRVISFASTTALDPNYVVEIFRLGKEKDSLPEVEAA